MPTATLDLLLVRFVFANCKLILYCIFYFNCYFIFTFIILLLYLSVIGIYIIIILRIVFISISTSRKVSLPAEGFDRIPALSNLPVAGIMLSRGPFVAVAHRNTTH